VPLPLREPDPHATPLRYTPPRPPGGARDASERIMATIARCSALLSRSLDLDATMLSTLEAVIPSVADWGVLQVPVEAGEPDACHVLHADEERRELLEQLSRFPFARASSLAESHAGPRGSCHLVSGLDRLATGRDSSEVLALRELCPTRLAILPLTAGPTACATLALAVAESGRDFSAEDVSLLGVLGEQFGVALHAARLFRRAERAPDGSAERLAELAHDLKNTLHSVSLALTLLSSPDFPSERRVAQIEIIERAVLLMDQRLPGAFPGRGPG